MAKNYWTAGPTTRQRILEIFPTVDFEEAIALVGLFYEYDFEFNDRTPQVRLRPLEPQLASAIVADIYGLDGDRLFHEFYSRWGQLRGSQESAGLLSRIMTAPGATRCQQFEREY